MLNHLISRLSSFSLLEMSTVSEVISFLFPISLKLRRCTHVQFRLLTEFFCSTIFLSPQFSSLFARRVSNVHCHIEGQIKFQNSFHCFVTKFSYSLILCLTLGMQISIRLQNQYRVFQNTSHIF